MALSSNDEALLRQVYASELDYTQAKSRVDDLKLKSGKTPDETVEQSAGEAKLRHDEALITTWKGQLPKEAYWPRDLRTQVLSEQRAAEAAVRADAEARRVEAQTQIDALDLTQPYSQVVDQLAALMREHDQWATQIVARDTRLAYLDALIARQSVWP